MEDLKKEILGLVDLYEENRQAIYPGNIVGHFFTEGHTRLKILEAMEELGALNSGYAQELKLLRRLEETNGR